MRIQDSFLRNMLQVSFTGIVDVSNGSYILWPRATWKFKKKFSLDVYYTYINSRLQSVLGYYNDNDIISVRVRYEF